MTQKVEINIHRGFEATASKQLTYEQSLVAGETQLRSTSSGQLAPQQHLLPPGGLFSLQQLQTLRHQVVVLVLMASAK